MKNLLLMAFFTAMFSLFSTSDVLAQQQLINNTKCPMVVAFEYGPPGGCQMIGYAITTVPAGTAMPAPMPPGMEIKQAKGTYVTGGCNSFYVGLPCTIYNTVSQVNCSVQCGDFEGTLTPMGVIINN